MRYSIILLILVISTTCFATQPQKSIYTDRSGSIIIRAWQNESGITRYYGPTGNKLGYSYQTGPRVNYYGATNNHIGSATQVGNGFRYFNSQGKQVGRTK